MKEGKLILLPMVAVALFQFVGIFFLFGYGFKEFFIGYIVVSALYLLMLKIKKQNMLAGLVGVVGGVLVYFLSIGIGFVALMAFSA